MDQSGVSDPAYALHRIADTASGEGFARALRGFEPQKSGFAIARLANASIPPTIAA